MRMSLSVSIVELGSEFLVACFHIGEIFLILSYFELDVGVG